MMFQRLLSLLAAGACVQVYFAAGQNDFIVDSSNGASFTMIEGQTGNCIVLQQCNFAMDIIQKNGIGSKKAQNFLWSNQCGFEKNIPKVCCPDRNGNPDDRNPSTEAGNHIEDSNNQVGGSTNNSNENPSSLLPAQCGEDQSNRIIGGEMTELDEFPWMAVLEYQRGQQGGFTPGCGGALITRRYVLTAAHCIRAIPSTWHLVHVRLGEYDMRTDPDCMDEGNGKKTCADPVMLVPVEREIVHENYMRPEIYRNDIALLRLAIDVPTTRYVQPICLPESANTSPRYHAAGWGQIEYRPNSPIKLKVTLPYIGLDECAVPYSSQKVVLGDDQMCAGGKFGKDTCKGDSGGPLMKQIQKIGRPNRWVVDGLVSIGHSPCGLPGWPGVYTKVHNYVPWILSKLQP